MSRQSLGELLFAPVWWLVAFALAANTQFRVRKSARIRGLSSV
jgi:hypothetical protein